MLPSFESFHQKFSTHYKIIIDPIQARRDLAFKWLHEGYGIEVGAGFWPTPLSKKHFVLYGDTKTKDRQHYLFKELLPHPQESNGFVDVDFKWPPSIGLSNLDFFICNYTLHLVEDPITFLSHASSFLKKGARAMFTVPDATVQYDMRTRTLIWEWLTANANKHHVRSKKMEFAYYYKKLRTGPELLRASKLYERYENDPELWVFDKLSLRPLIENALKYGEIPMKLVVVGDHKGFKELTFILEKII